MDKCPIGYFEFNYICYKCDSSCLECSNPLPNKCTKCRNGNYYYEGMCLINCPNKYFKDNTNNVCAKCHSSCLTCTGLLET